jgi:hypothetical protein
MPANKGKLISTVEGVMKSMTAAAIRPTAELSPREMVFFDLIVNSRETATWSGNDRMIATQLAKTHRRIEELNVAIDEEGFTQVNDRGTQISNPKFAALTQLQAQVQSATRTLGLSASQRALTGTNQKGRNEADARAREVVARASSSDLLG